MNQVILSERHRRVVVPHNAAVANLTPHAAAFDWQGTPHMALPHDEDHVRLVRNFGIVVPAPVLKYYDWAGGTPYEAQRNTVAMLSLEKRAYVLNSFGTGKTRTVLWAYDYLRRIGEVKSMLVVAPLSTLSMTWAREAFTVCPHLKVKVLFGSSAKRVELLAEPADIYVVNHDGLPIILKHVMARKDINQIVIDELAVYRNQGTHRFKKMRALLTTKDRVWGLTGSPTPNAPTDAWAQIKLVTPWSVQESFSGFKFRTMTQVSQFKWVPKPSAVTTVAEAMQPSVRYTLEDTVELPEVIARIVEVEQSALQKQAYTELRRHMTIMLDKGEVTAVNAGILMNKLLQVSMGWVYSTTRGSMPLGADKRLATLVDLIESTEQKVIVFVPFLHVQEGVAKYLEAHGLKCAIVNGDVSPKERDRIFNAFQHSLDTRVIVAHPKCMAHGLTLTAADTIIWYGPYPSLEETEQANARITRIGQKFKQHIIMLAGTPVEHMLYKRLREKQAVQNALLDLLRDTTKQ